MSEADIKHDIPYDESIIPNELKEWFIIEELIFHLNPENARKAKAIIENLSPLYQESVASLICQVGVICRMQFKLLADVFSVIKVKTCDCSTSPELSMYLSLKGLIDNQNIITNYQDFVDDFEDIFRPDSPEYAIIHDDLDKVAFFSADSSKFERKSSSYWFEEETTYLGLAAISASVNVFKYLHANGWSITKDVANNAIKGGSLEIVEICSQSDADFSDSLPYGIAFHHHDLTIWLIDQFGFDNIDISFCIEKFNTLAFCYLLKQGRNINEYSKIYHCNHQLMTAFVGSYPIMNYMLNHGIDINLQNNHFSMIYIAAQYGYLELFKELKNRGAEVDLYEIMKLAAHRNKFHVLNYLIELGLNIDHFYNEKTLLAQAILDSNSELTKYLVLHGAQLNLKVKNISYLHLAITSKKLTIAEYLIDKGILLDTQDEQGRTPLIYAVKTEQIQLVNYLLLKGANPNIKDKHNKTAHNYSMRAVNKEIQQVFSKYVKNQETE